MTLLELRLKPLTDRQLNAVVKLDQLCLGGLWSQEGYRRELNSPNSELLVLSVLGNRGSPPKERIVGIGCFWAILEEAHITILAIHPDCQSQGLGQVLLWTLLQKAVRQKLDRATLEVRASNQAALSLYQKFGFQVAGRRKKYYQNNNEDALILWRGGLQQKQFSQLLDRWQQQTNEKLARCGWRLENGDRKLKA
ncbi:ribosomal protein S18-alanine N-acetyltransferase [Lusitaniella coriacea LEGE 07157]|uniref:Ribosomal protein S18-alanine N-acetyltransferase n=1 Tax=Lusitaniella coriacea LEGE 07157 TaxID=945747 RepID=A0A8J7E0W9_9CYAN|nr:ribosomal protein S18-alanine N-acetyltransferase [Lusitaniella coriacea]MBE9118456.1 ribosomal protein S18-alanine N-acetyltransferase [Lusitaniella coriacea LEGE 07157]